MAAEAALWNGRYWEAPGIDFIAKPVSERPIKNGQRISMTIQSRFNITADQIKAVEQGELIICAVGELTYIDRLDTQRRTGFRRNYNVSTDMFDTSPSRSGISRLKRRPVAASDRMISKFGIIAK